MTLYFHKTQPISLFKKNNTYRMSHSSHEVGSVTTTGQQLLDTVLTLLNSQDDTNQVEKLNKLIKWVQEFKSYNSKTYLVTYISLHTDAKIILEQIMELVESGIAGHTCVMYIVFLESLMSTAKYQQLVNGQLQSARKLLCETILSFKGDTWIKDQQILAKPNLWFKKFLSNTCRKANQLKTEQDEEIFVQSLRWENLADSSTRLDWDDVWGNINGTQKQRSVLIYAITQRTDDFQPKPLTSFYHVAKVLGLVSTDMPYLFDVLQLISIDDKLRICLNDALKNLKFCETIIPIIDRYFEVEIFCSIMMQLLKTYNPPCEFFEPVFERVVSLCITTKHEQDFQILYKFAEDNKDFLKYLISGVMKCQYTSDSSIEFLKNTLVDLLTNDQVSRLIGYQSARESFIPAVYALDISRGVGYDAIKYYAICAARFHGRNESGATFLLQILAKYNLYHIIPSSDTKNFLNNWMKNNNTTTRLICKDHAYKFITELVPDDNEWDDRNIFSYILKCVFNEFYKCANIDKEYWMNNRGNYHSRKSRFAAELLLYRLFYQLGVPKLFPEPFPWDISSNPFVSELIEQEYNQFNNNMETGNISFSQWGPIIRDELLFRQLKKFCVEAHDRQLLTRRFENAFCIIKKFDTILTMLVNHFNVDAKKELIDIQRLSEVKENVILREIEECLKTIKPLTDIAILDLDVVLRSKLFITRYNEMIDDKEITMAKSAEIINQVIQSVKNLFTNGTSCIENLQLGSIVSVITYYEDLSREVKFLEQIGCDPQSFSAAQNLYIRGQMLGDLHLIATDEYMGFHQTIASTADFKNLFKLCGNKVLLRDTVKNLGIMRSITDCATPDISNADKKAIHTWPLFANIIQCKDLYIFCSDAENRPDEAMKQIILQMLDEFESCLMHNYYECVAILEPFIKAHTAAVTLKQFFNILADLNIHSVDTARQLKCLNTCNGQKEIEMIKEIFDNTSMDEHTFSEKAKEMIQRGIFTINLRGNGCDFEVQYMDKKNHKCICSQHNFRDLLNNAMFKKDSCDLLRNYSDVSCQLINIYDCFVKLNIIGHVAFQNETITLQMDNIDLLFALNQKLPVLERDWKIANTEYDNYKHLSSFSSKQILILSQYLSTDQSDSNFQFYQIIASCFNLSKRQLEQERNSFVKLAINKPQHTWLNMFESSRRSILEYTSSMFQIVGQFLEHITRQQKYDTFESENLNLELFHDIASLDIYNQALYLVSLSTFSCYILICKSTTSDTEVMLKIKIHEKMTSGRVVIFGVDKLSTPVRIILTNYLIKARNTLERQFICIILGSALRNMLPSFVIHAGANTESRDTIECSIAKVTKFHAVEYFKELSGYGKTHTIHKRMNDIVPNKKAQVIINLNISTTVEDIIEQLSKPLHSFESGSIYFNIAHDAKCEVVNQILMELLIIGSCSSSETGMTVTVPKSCKDNWTVFIEMPSIGTSTITTGLHSVALFGKKGELCKKYELSDQDVDTISFIAHFLKGSGALSNEYLLLSHDSCIDTLNCLLAKYCKSIPVTVENTYSLRTMAHFIAFMTDKCLRGLKEDAQFIHNEVFGWTLPHTFILLFLHEAENFLNSAVQHNMRLENHPYVYSIKSSYGSIGVVSFQNTNSVKYAPVATGFANLERLEMNQSMSNATCQRVLNIDYMNIDYKLVEYLASALGAREKQVSLILEKHKYILIPEYLHKFIQVNQRLRINLPTIIEGDSGTGKTKLVEIYSDIMTSSHCDPVADLIIYLIMTDTKVEFDISDTCEVIVIMAGKEEKVAISGYLRAIKNEMDHQIILDVMHDILNFGDIVLKERSINRLCQFCREFFSQIFNRKRTKEDIFILNGCKDRLDNIMNLELPENRVESLEFVIKILASQGRAYLSTIMVSKMIHIIRTEIIVECKTLMITDVKSLAMCLLEKLDQNRLLEALMSYVEYTLPRCVKKVQLLQGIVIRMIDFIDVHPLMDPPLSVLNYLRDPNRDNNLFPEMLRLYLTMPRHSPFISVLMHSGLQPKDVFEHMSKFIELAKTAESCKQCSECKGCANFVGFIDEANSTKQMGMLSRLLVDHRWSEYSLEQQLPKNISWICAINPYDSDGNAAKKRFNVQEESVSMKSFRFFWDQLDEIQLAKYVQSKISMSKVLYSLSLSESVVSGVRDLIMRSHEFLAKVLLDKRIRSTVSQRDIHRVFHLFEWFYTRDDMNTVQNRPNRLLFSVLMAIAFCYYFRLTGEHRNQLSINIYNWTMELFEKGVVLSEMVDQVMNYFVDQMEVPPFVFKNYALKQNMFTLIVCIENRMPITLIGPPGCSKTLSFQIVQNNMGMKGFMKSFQRVDSVHRYQGSSQSTSEEIEKVCIKASKAQQFYDEKHLKKLSLFFFDEAGVPESEKESLKVLHYYLNNSNFPAVLITNDPLDVAKSNRGIEILVSSPDEEDLAKLAEGIIKRHENENLTPETRKVIEACCRAYKYLINDNNECKTSKKIKNWIGMRDFYHFIRFIRKSSAPDSIDITPELLLQSLERNFNGLKQPIFRKIVKTFFDECSKESPSFQTCTPNYRLNLDVLKDSLSDTNRGEDIGNFNDTSVRFKLIVDESMDESLSRILSEAKVVDASAVEELSLSSFSDDNNELQRVILVSKITAAMASGKTVVLTNTRSIDGSFYDLYNQRYQITIHNNEIVYFATIAVGAVSEYRRVHKDFQCIIHIRGSEVNSLEQVFLNRFEKFSISPHDALLYKRRKLSVEQNKNLDIVIDRLKIFCGYIQGIQNYNNVVFTCDIDATIVSLVLSTITEAGRLELPKTWHSTRSSLTMIGATDNLQILRPRLYLQFLLARLIQIIRPECFILNLNNLPKPYLVTYFRDQRHMDMKMFLEDMIERCNVEWNDQRMLKYMVYCPITSSIMDHLPPNRVCEVVGLDEIQSRDKFIELATKFCQSPQNMFILLVNDNYIDDPLVHQIRRIIETEVSNLLMPNKKVFIILCSFRQVKFAAGTSALFLNNWEHFYVDGSTNHDLQNYILELCPGPLQHNIPHLDVEWSELEKLIRAAPRKIAHSTGLAVQSTINNNFLAPYSTNQSLSAMVDLLIRVLSSHNLALVRNALVELCRVFYTREFRAKMLQIQARSILDNSTHMNLAIHVRDSTSKTYTAVLAKFVHMILDSSYILPLLELQDDPSIGIYIVSFISVEYFGSIDKLMNSIDNTYPLPAPNFIPRIPFSHEIIAHVNDILFDLKLSLGNLNNSHQLLEKLNKEMKSASSVIINALQIINASDTLKCLLMKDAIVLTMRHLFSDTSKSSSNTIVDVVLKILLSLHLHTFNDVDISVESILVLCRTERGRLDSVITSIKPLVDFGIIDESLDSILTMDNIIESWDNWILEVSTSFIQTKLDQYLDQNSLTAIVRWCLCVNAVFTRSTPNKSAYMLQILGCILRYSNVVPSEIQCQALKKLLVITHSTKDLVAAIAIMIADDKVPAKNRKLIISSILRYFVSLYGITSDEKYIDLVMQIVNGSHLLNRYCNVAPAMGVYILSSMLYDDTNRLVAEVMKCVYSTVTNGDSIDIVEYAPIFFIAEKEPMSHNSMPDVMKKNLLQVIYDLEFSRMECISVKDLVKRLGPELSHFNNKSDKAKSLYSSIVISAINNKLVEAAGILFSQNLLVSDLNPDVLEIISQILLSNYNYQLVFMKSSLNRMSGIDFIEQLKDPNNGLNIIGMNKWIANAASEEMVSSSFSFMQDETLSTYALFHDMKILFIRACNERATIHQLILFLQQNIQRDGNNLYHFRMFLVCIAHRSFYKKAKICANSTGMLQQLGCLNLTVDEIKIITLLLDLSTIADDQGCVATKLKSVDDQWNDNIFNFIAMIFGMHQNTYLYNLLFNIQTCKGNYIAGNVWQTNMSGGGSHRGYLDCGTKMNEDGQLCCGNHPNLGITALYLIYFLTFGFMAIQLQLFPGTSFDTCHDHIFSQQVDDETAPDDLSKLKQFIFSRSNGNWLHYWSKSGLTADQTQRLIVVFAEDLQSHSLNRQVELEFQTLNSSEIEINLEKFLQTRFNYYYNDITKLELPTRQGPNCIDSINDFSKKCQNLVCVIDKDQVIRLFNNSPDNARNYPILALYMQNKARFELSSLLCYCAELYVWLSTALNNLLPAADLQRPVHQIISRYRYKNPAKADILMNRLRKMIETWNNYIDIFNGFQFECQIGAVRENLTQEVQLQFFLSFSEIDKSILEKQFNIVVDNNRIFAAMHSLVQIHNDNFVSKVNEHLELLGYPNIQTEVDVYLLNASNAEQFMFQPEQDFETVSMSHATGFNQVDWESLQDQILSTRMLYKPRMVISEEILFKVRQDQVMFAGKEQDNLYYLTCIPDVFKKPIEEQIRSQICEQYHNIDREQILDMIDALRKVIDEHSPEVGNTTLEQLVQHRAGITMEASILELNTDQTGTVIELFTNKSSDMDYNYKHLDNRTKKKFTADQLSSLDEELQAMETSDKLMDDMLELQGYLLSMEPYICSLFDKDITVGKYLMDCLGLENDDPMVIILDKYSAHYYMAIQQFIQRKIAYYRSKRSTKTVDVVWREFEGDSIVRKQNNWYTWTTTKLVAICFLAGIFLLLVLL